MIKIDGGKEGEFVSEDRLNKFKRELKIERQYDKYIESESKRNEEIGKDRTSERKERDRN